MSDDAPRADAAAEGLSEQELGEMESRGYWGCHGGDRDMVLDSAYEFCREDAPRLIAEVRRLRRAIYTPYTCDGCGAQHDGSDRQRMPKDGQRAFCSTCRSGNRAAKKLWARDRRALQAGGAA